MPTYRVRGASPQQIVNSVSRSIQRAVRDLRPIHVADAPPSTEGNSEGSFGNHQYFIDPLGAVRLYEKGISTNALPQWREIATAEVGGPVKYELNNTWDMTVNDESAIIIEQSGAGDASIEFEILNAGTSVQRYSIGADNSQAGNPFVIYDATAGVEILFAKSTIFDLMGGVIEIVPGSSITWGLPSQLIINSSDTINLANPCFDIQNNHATGDVWVGLGGTTSGWRLALDRSTTYDDFVLYDRTNNLFRISVDGSTGNVTILQDLRVDGGDIGITTDTDLIQIAANLVTINGTLTATTITGMAPSDATYIVQTANATLTNEQVLGVLATGLVKNTTTTGVLSIGVADTDYQQPVTWGDGLAYSAPTASVDFNTTSLKITAAQLDTIQSIATAASPTFAGVTLSGLTATRIMATGASSQAASVANLASWIAGTANQITIADDLDGTITLSTPQSIHTAASPTFAGLDLTEGNITNVGSVALDSITADGTTITIGGTPSIVLTNGTTIAVTLGNDAGDDLTVDGTVLVVEGDSGNVGIGTASPKLSSGISAGTIVTVYSTSGSAVELGASKTTADFIGDLVWSNAAIVAADKRIGQITVANTDTTDYNSGEMRLYVWKDGAYNQAVTITELGGILCSNTGGTPATQANRAGIFAADVAASAELFGLDEAGNTPQLTPHDPATGEAYLHSTNWFTGKRQTIWHERVARLVEQIADRLGIPHKSLIEELRIPREERWDWDVEQARMLRENPKYVVKPMPEFIRLALEET